MKYILIAREDEIQISFLSRLQTLYQRSRRAAQFKIVDGRGQTLADLLSMSATLVKLEERDFSETPSPLDLVHGLTTSLTTSSITGSPQFLNDFASSLPPDVRVIWLRDEQLNTRAQPSRLIHSLASPAKEVVPWMTRVDLVLNKKDLDMVTSEELVMFFGLNEVPSAQLDGVVTLQALMFSPELRSISDPQIFVDQRVELWIHRQISLGCRWIELRSDLLDERQMKFAASLIPGARRLWSVRDHEHSDLIQKLNELYPGSIDWTQTSGSDRECWTQPRFISIRSRTTGQAIGDVLKQFPRVIEEGTQLHAEFEIESLEELVELENWRRAFPVARVTNPISNCGRWQWIRLLRGVDHPLSYFAENPLLDAADREQDRPGFLSWVRRRNLQKRERSRHGQIFFAAHILQLTETFVDVPAEAAPGHALSVNSPRYHAEFFAQFAAPLLEVKLTANELRSDGLSKLSRLGLRWAQLDSNLALLENANTWVCDFATLKWRGKWIDVTPQEGARAHRFDLISGRSKILLKPLRDQHEFWNRIDEESED